ncbi:Holliday junction recognition protein isoform X2 [Mus pahari]|uniref:Holliday junction recognition protein isoform X2 n=1 Tax=Mus pahari TaxID=10093 RepID=UPI000A30D9F8|nr:Holliday junction recognition protein isoform X2 [Mus pahari]
MESVGRQDRRLREQLNESRSRFQTLMQRLLAKYNQPFEDDPLVQMTTLTYQTSQGLRVWGGKLMTKGNQECTQNAEKRGGKDTVMTWVPSVTSPVTPATGCQDGISAKSSGGPKVSALSSRGQGPSYPCPADMAIVTRNDSLSLLETSSNCVSNQSFEVDDICNVTISDLYEGMMHSMSRLLHSKPSCIISTKTYINQSWKLRRRPSCKQGPHKNRTYCPRSKASQRSTLKGPSPSSEPGKEAGILRDYKNLPHVAPHKTGLELKSDSLEGSKCQVHKFSPAWKELQMMPQKGLDLNLQQENRAMALQWLISPVKMVPRPRMLPSQVEKWYREIKIKFDKLHQEYCVSSGKQSHLTGPTESWAVDVYRSGSKSPGSRQGVETRRLSSPFSRVKTERPGEALEDLRGKSVKTNGCLLRSSPSPEGSLSQSPGHSQQSSDLQHNSQPTGKAVLPSTAISAPCIDSPGRGKNNYDELKKEFNRLYQKYCLVSPQRAKVTSCGRVSPMKATVAVPCQTEHLKRLNPDSPLQSYQKWSLSPGCRIRVLQDSTAVEAHTSAQTASALVREPWLSTKRRKLSYPVACAHQAKSQDSSGASGWP